MGLHGNNTNSPVVGWDLTIFAPLDKDAVAAVFSDKCSHWVFQLERGTETARQHFQCRVRLSRKSRNPNMPSDWIGHFSPTSRRVASSGTHEAFNYVLKEDTREDGPWADSEFEDTLNLWHDPHFDNMEWYPWQQRVLDDPRDDRRTINCIIDPQGNSGKSSICAYAAQTGKALFIPAINDYLALSQILYAKCQGLKNEPGLLLVDMPRSMPKVHLAGLFSAVESIKNGYSFETRYRFREHWFVPPAVWLFMNEWPDLHYLSADRWKFFQIDRADMMLVEAQHPKATPAYSVPEPANVPVNDIEHINDDLDEEELDSAVFESYSEDEDDLEEPVEETDDEVSHSDNEMLSYISPPYRQRSRTPVQVSAAYQPPGDQELPSFLRDLTPDSDEPHGDTEDLDSIEFK